MILEQLKRLFEQLNIPIESGVLTGRPPDTYVVLTPMTDRFELFADDRPEIDVEEVRISLFTRENYIKLKNLIAHKLLQSDFTITERRYIEFENDTRYHHYAIDVEKERRCRDDNTY